MRPILLASVMLLAAAPAMARAPSPAVAAAVAEASRPDKDRERDAARHPADIIAFAKIKPGDKVIDIWTGSGYWSRLFSRVVGPKGHVYAYVPAEIAKFKSDPVAVAKAVAAEPGLGNIEAISDPIAAPPPPEQAGTLDAAFIFQNYHDLHDKFMGGADVAAYNKAVFAALKPGGYYVIIDHAAAPGAGLTHTDDLHRIDVATVKAEVKAAGFRLDGESKLLADPTDPHTANVFDKAVRGKTDQFALRFVKPRR